MTAIKAIKKEFKGVQLDLKPIVAMEDQPGKHFRFRARQGKQDISGALSYYEPAGGVKGSVEVHGISSTPSRAALRGHGGAFEAIHESEKGKVMSPKFIRSALRKLKEQFPGAETVEGVRVTGVHGRQKSRTKSRQIMKLPDSPVHEKGFEFNEIKDSPGTYRFKTTVGGRSAIGTGSIRDGEFVIEGITREEYKDMPIGAAKEIETKSANKNTGLLRATREEIGKKTGLNVSTLKEMQARTPDRETAAIAYVNKPDAERAGELNLAKTAKIQERTSGGFMRQAIKIAKRVF